MERVMAGWIEREKQASGCLRQRKTQKKKPALICGDSKAKTCQLKAKIQPKGEEKM